MSNVVGNHAVGCTHMDQYYPWGSMCAREGVIKRGVCRSASCLQVEKTKKGVRNLGLWTDCYYKGGVVTCNDPPFPEAQNDSCTGLYSGAAAMSILGCVFLLFSLGCLFPIACNAVPRYRVMIVRYCTILNIFLGTAFSTVCAIFCPPFVRPLRCLVVPCPGPRVAFHCGDVLVCCRIVSIIFVLPLFTGCMGLVADSDQQG